MVFKANNRWQAFGVHIGISLVLFLALAAVIYFFWYPGFLFRYDGGLEGMKLIAGVDFFIGPLLTLFIYRLGKKSLKFDLTCIAVLQVTCLAGGMWTVWQTRPVAVVYAVGEFMSINRLGYVDIGGVKPEKIEILKAGWPVWVMVDIPEEQEGLNKVWAVMGSSMHYSTENYVSYRDHLDKLAKRGVKSTDIKIKDQVRAEELEKSNASLRFFPVTTSMSSGYLAVDITTGKEVAFLE